MNKIVLGIIIILLILTATFGKLSYDFYADNRVLGQKIEKLVEKNNELDEQLRKSRESAKIDDKYTVELIQTNKTMDDIQSSTDKKIERIEQNRSLKTNAGGNSNETTKTNDISINDKLPDDISNVLREQFDSLQRARGGGNATK